MKFSDLPLLSIGNTIQLIGAVYQGEGETYLMLLPGESVPLDLVDRHSENDVAICVPLELSPEDWKNLLRQSDLVETEVFFGEKKAVLRKCERNVDSKLQWDCFRRDNFRCQYCSAVDVQLTYDHLIPWELSGPTILSNVLCVCKRCNRTRGNTPYHEWLESDYYKRVSQNLDEETKAKNLALVKTLCQIKLVDHIRSR